MGWVGRVHVDSELAEGILRALSVELTFASEPRESGGHDGFGIDLEEATEVLTVIAATEAVGAE